MIPAVRRIEAEMLWNHVLLQLLGRLSRAREGGTVIPAVRRIEAEMLWNHVLLQLLGRLIMLGEVAAVLPVLEALVSGAGREVPQVHSDPAALLFALQQLAARTRRRAVMVLIAFRVRYLMDREGAVLFQEEQPTRAELDEWWRGALAVVHEETGGSRA